MADQYARQVVSRRRRPLLFAIAIGFTAAIAPALVASAAPAQDNTGGAFGGQISSVSAVTSTTLPGSTGIATTTVATSQTLVTPKDPPSQRLATESHKVMAVIGGLIVVALSILLLTMRYWRSTRPVPPVEEPVVDESALVAPAVVGARRVYEPVVAPPGAVSDSVAHAPAVVAEADVVDATVAVDPPVVDEPAAAGEAAANAEPAVTQPTADEPAVPAEAATAVTTVAEQSTDHVGADDDWEPHTGEHARVELPTTSVVPRPSAAARRRALGLPTDS